MTSEEQAVRRSLDDFMAADRARDLPRLLSMLADDCVFLMPGRPPVAGKAAVEALYRQYYERYADAEVDHTATIEELQVAGDWAYWWGVDAVTITPPAGAPPIKARGHGMGILRRGADGTWKQARGINNMMAI